MKVSTFLVYKVKKCLLKSGKVNGFFTTTVSIGYVYGIAGVFIGNLIGSWVFRHLSGFLLKYIIYAYIGISGLAFLLGA